ncbi:Protein MEI2-like 4 [Acorus calamus]|uniref:Protein MEI2-like 4 n=1 Tax=Acorus calamus TaxID=4465 RepID=A0AAV9E895_ACOCL|nr:Protein MEI2-like 4 [Acorus calamus]
MPSEDMDQRPLSSAFLPSTTSSFFADEVLPAERQVGFWKSDSMLDHHGIDGMTHLSDGKSFASSPQEKFQTMGVNSMERLDLHLAYYNTDQKSNFSLEHRLSGTDRSVGLPRASWSAMEQNMGCRRDLLVQPASHFMEGNKVHSNHHESSLFSSSLSDIFKKKMSLSSHDAFFGQSIDVVDTHLGEDEPFESLEELEAQTIGNLLPDDDDLLSGVVDGLDYLDKLHTGDELEDDLFYSGGGMELEADDSLRGTSSESLANGLLGGSNAQLAGEHPYGEHPSRTLFVRNINSNVEDAELKALFELYGDIRALYTACKHRGFVMISYYDIRAARNAMRELQNKPLRRRKLDIHYSIPKVQALLDNPSEKDINQGTLVVFNLDSSVSNDELRQRFGVYGEIKEIRETPHKRHHKFIEFYDVRAAEAALRALNRSDIAGKRIKLEPSRPGGARRCLMQQFSPELELEEAGEFRQQSSPPNNSPSGGYVHLGSISTDGLDAGPTKGLHSAVRVPIANSFMDTAFYGISSSVPQTLSSSPVGNHGNLASLTDSSHSLRQMKYDIQSVPTLHPHSLPEYHDGIGNGYNSPGVMSTMGMNINSRPNEGIENRLMHRVGLGSLNSHLFDISDGVHGASGNGSCPVHGHRYIWANSNSHHAHPPNHMMWPISSSIVNNIPAHPPSHLHGLPRPPSQTLNTGFPLHQHYVGSAPDASVFHPGSLGRTGFSGGSTMHPMDFASHNMQNIGLPSPQQRCHMFHGRNPLIPMPSNYDAPNERVRSRRIDASAHQADNKKQYELDIERIIHGEDVRTTLMIKNIPNKYTSKMLLSAIDEHHRGTYDFIYLPIDFKNKCNVGYAFINMIDPQQIIPFYKAFNGKKWEKFNSEKVASLAYARIQGKSALIAHFQNSSLMNEDKRCRPILFHSEGPNAGDQEPFPMGVNIRSRPGRHRSSSNEESNEEEHIANAIIDTSSGSTKDSE